MPYPPAPWILKGEAIQTIHLLDAQTARSFVPSELSIIEVLPGKTLGSVYLGTYASGSTLEYHELIVASGIVRYGKQLGGWISHIYVDHPDSVAGGQEIWGLPKELAEFDWQTGPEGKISVRQAEKVLCRMTYQTPFPLWQQQLTVPGLSRLGSRFLTFPAQAQFRPALVQAELEIPESSPFSPLDLGWSWLTVYLAELHLVAGVPVELT